MNTNTKSQWALLGLLGIIGIVSMVVFGNFAAAIVLMGLSYLSNTSYSVVSRSGTRNSALFHGIAVLASTFIFYLVLNRLVTSELTLALFIPYTVATVYGSFTGATFSMKVEKAFGITTSNVKPTSEEAKRRERMARNTLFSILTVLVLSLVIFTRHLPATLTLTIVGAMFLQEMVFSMLRRSRNSSNVGYHIAVSLLHSAAWYLLYKTLAENKMSPELFLPYCTGSVLGSLFGQEVSRRIEKVIGASADAHLSSGKSVFIPWTLIAVLGGVSLLFVALTGGSLGMLGILSLAAFQQIAFSVVSRSRQRNNMLYHIIASVFSNGVWFLTFRQVHSVGNWKLAAYIPYATGSAMGSITGVGISMGIEKALNITSDVKPVPKTA